MTSVETFRNYWLSFATSPADEASRPNNWSLEEEFWRLAGFGETFRYPEGPPRIEGLAEIARDYLAAATSPDRAEASRKTDSASALRWCSLAENAGLLDDDLFGRVLRSTYNSWAHIGLSGDGRADLVRIYFNGEEPARGSAGAYVLETGQAMAARFNRVVEAAIRTLDPAFWYVLSLLDYEGKDRLIEACRKIEDLEITSLGHERYGEKSLRSVLARMAASDFEVDDEAGLTRELEGFRDRTLMMVEEFSEPARPVIRALLAKRPGAVGLLRLKDALIAGLMRPGEFGESPKAPASGEFDAEPMKRLIAAVPADTFRGFRESLVDGELAESMASVLDALLGTNRQKLEKSLKHHSQMALKCLALLPLPDSPEERREETRKRYLVIDHFVKSSRKFGVQRQANNRTCAEIALGNLALNAGYDDADELFFEVESRLAADSAGAGFAVGGYRVGLEFDASGPAIAVEKEGKPLKALPPVLKKSAGYKELKETFEALREQSRRFRRALEKRMAVAVAIERKSFEALWRAPLLRGLLATLVFVDDEGNSGMVDESGETLSGVDGTRIPLDGRPLRIAHPVVLERLGVLAAWRRHCLEREVIQALRQVFREFYTVTPAELDSSPVSFRFAGHWMAGGILSGLLKSRGWNCAGNDGPEPRKPFGSAGITGHFDLEECGHYLTETESVRSAGVSFRDRTGAKLPLDAVPETIFSEVMRDADLFVSVAQTTEGGLPSKELLAQRVALLQGLIGKLRIKGVSVDGHHALIDGKRSRYRVHLASGAVHMGAAHHLCIVPASSWKRPAKLFLPFVEEDDRRIAEIFSKILLLANDDKITDPGILSQIGAAGGG